MPEGSEQWTAGFEMGRLDQQLSALVLRDRPVGLTIRSVNRDQAEAIAQRHGYVLRWRPVEEPGCEWAVFSPAS